MIKYAIGSILLGVLFLIASALGFSFGLVKAALGYDPVVITALLIMILIGITFVVYGFIIVNQVIINHQDSINKTEMDKLKEEFPYASDDLLNDIKVARNVCTTS